MIEILLIILCAVMLIYITRIKSQIKQAAAVLNDIADGNLDRRIITQEDTGISELCYKINEIVINMKAEIVNHQQSEKAYRQLITSLSHDIRTPLASLIGYLSAVNDGIVENKEKEEYIHLSLEKAFDLKDYVDTLFEWLKLESGEHKFHFEESDICEFTREIITDWIPQIESKNLEYDIIIPETKINIDIDRNAYKRIINNLLQNIFIHSNANKIFLNICTDNRMVEILISDNGTGISEKDLPYIFDRLYKCDTTRGIRGNGLGLSIVHELVKANNGKIAVSSIYGQGTDFTLTFHVKTR
jgi:Signal transduction histidine kinase